ncbi:methyltransferase-like protein 22 isoform X7 [Ursus americanus]|uniref:methyltransferase-like protein 22 isoform X7 n=1 Tax=Ursus americanus TaxID=9643 RepID=UPI001E67A9ED|nr:methyltransferase-like protein 22 isoform X7 [Ursus americanus]
MDEVTFKSDTVLSDVHLYTPNHRHFMVRLNGMGQPEHTMATPLEDVGKQVWRGALLLADYILFQRDVFQGRTVLELGAGTGLASIIAATVARTVYCTDVGTDLLAMCQRNIALNSHLTAAGGGVVKVKELDWLKDDLCTDPEVPFSWSQEDVSDLYSHTTILLAAEVFYDDDLTDALFKTLSRLAHKLKNACTAILSVEKRLNFTLRHLDVTCEAYDHFRSWLQRLERLADGRLRFAVEPVEASFPQLLVYERIQQLVGAAPTTCGPSLLCMTLLTPGPSRHMPRTLVLSGWRSASTRKLWWVLPILSPAHGPAGQPSPWTLERVLSLWAVQAPEAGGPSTESGW